MAQIASPDRTYKDADRLDGTPPGPPRPCNRTLALGLRPPGGLVDSRDVRKGNSTSMSLASIHQLIGLAAIDPQFCQELLANPLATIQAQGIELTVAEQEALQDISAQNLSEFSSIVLARLGLEQP